MIQFLAPFAPIVVPVGTALTTVFAYFFRVGAVTFLVKAALFALLTFAGYAVSNWIFPEWLSVAAMQERLNSFAPPVAYGLHLVAFYDGVKYLLGAMSAAWILKKLPVSVWLGALFRVS